MKKISILLIGFLITLTAQLSFAEKNLCANCYWDDSCGSITTVQVEQYGLMNSAPVYKGTSDAGPFKRFVCDNGSNTLGVLWSKKSCDKIGGLTGLNKENFADYDNVIKNKKCKFGYAKKKK